MPEFDWNDLRYFLAVARLGNPSRAASSLGADHTTVRRRLSALESALKTKLFDTRQARYVLTDQGERLMRTAEGMEGLALSASEQISDSADAISGTVRVAASSGFGSYFLAPRLPDFSLRYPKLQVQLVILSRGASVSQREADLAVLPAPPEHGREVVRKLTECRLGLFAAQRYLKSAPPLNDTDDLRHHRLIGYINDRPVAPDEDYFPRIARTLRPQFETNSAAAQLQAAVAGQGIAFLPFYMAAREPSLRQVLRKSMTRSWEYWLAAPADLRASPKIRAISEFIVNEVKAAHDIF